MTVSRLLARPLLASMFVVGGAGSLKDPAGKVPAAKPVIDTVVPALQKAVPQVPIPTDPTTLVRINGAAQLLAGLALATGRAPRTSAAVLAATPAPHDRRRAPVLGGEGQGDPLGAADPLLQERLDARRADARGRRHGGQARRGLACPARGQGREARGEAARPRCQARGPAGRQVDRLILSPAAAGSPAAPGWTAATPSAAPSRPPYAAKATGIDATVASAPKPAIATGMRTSSPSRCRDDIRPR